MRICAAFVCVYCVYVCCMSVYYVCAACVLRVHTCVRAVYVLFMWVGGWVGGGVWLGVHEKICIYPHAIHNARRLLFV